jgi:Sec7-like guanine-nucleotide exchange factor
MRSKVLCLTIIHSLLRDFMPVFNSPFVMVRFSRESVDFMQASKNSICLALAMNAPKPMMQVFEISSEIFSLIVNHMRGSLKSEIEVFFREIYLPILEMKVSSVDRKSCVVSTVLGPISRDARALVEMYLNYDCNGSLMSNIYERYDLHDYSDLQNSECAVKDHADTRTPHTCTNCGTSSCNACGASSSHCFSDLSYLIANPVASIPASTTFPQRILANTVHCQ